MDQIFDIKNQVVHENLPKMKKKNHTIEGKHVRQTLLNMLKNEIATIFVSYLIIFIHFIEFFEEDFIYFFDLNRIG